MMCRGPSSLLALACLSTAGCGPQDLEITVDPAPQTERVQVESPLLHVLPDDSHDYAIPPVSAGSGPDAPINAQSNGLSAEPWAQWAPPSEPRVALVFLAVDGLSVTAGAWSPANAQTNTSFLVVGGPADLPAFDASPWGADRGVVVSELIGELDKRFADFEVRFVTERPEETAYTTVVLGGASELLGQPAGIGGVSPLDAGDRNANDVVFVFSQNLGDSGYTLQELSSVIAHELGHSLGLVHIDRQADVMAVSACHCVTDWGIGAALDGNGVVTDEQQDGLAALATVLLPRGDGAPVCPWDDLYETGDDSDVTLIEAETPTTSLRCAGDDDRFAITAAAGCEVVTEVDFVHADGNLSLRMERPDGASGARSFGRGDQERTVEMAGDAGAPVARIYSYGDVQNAYTVTMRSHCAADVSCEGGDLHEPNEARGGAATRLYPPAAALGRTCEDDLDYFRFLVKKDCTAVAALAFTDDDGDLDMRLERYDGTVLDRSSSVSDDESTDWTADRSTLVYARVYGFRGAQNSYRIDVTTTCPD